ncbi:hypothetical protein [Pseudomonas sp. RIT-PI-AD]|uniref:hypothetical protein n=1 Tax=Pseudomonas sp. RIT-PI-AD TaxID=3035294 RepID=UPI0021DB2DC8|nr:hypothetical protein [Pseudomonas sp. RIT-PI-AD]
MDVYGWAKQALEETLEQARRQGFDDGLALRALLGTLVSRSKETRSAADLAAELLFLADNLDDERDYGFMRP